MSSSVRTGGYHLHIFSGHCVPFFINLLESQKVAASPLELSEEISEVCIESRQMDQTPFLLLGLHFLWSLKDGKTIF